MATAEVLWRVNVGLIREVLVVAPFDASLDEVGKAAKLAVLGDQMERVRPEHAEADESRTIDWVASMDVASIKRENGDLLALHPRIAVAPAPTEAASQPAGERRTPRDGRAIVAVLRRLGLVLEEDPEADPWAVPWQDALAGDVVWEEAAAERFVAELLPSAPVESGDDTRKEDGEHGD